MSIIDNINKSLDTTKTYTNKEKQPKKDSFTRICLFIITLHCISELFIKLIKISLLYATYNEWIEVLKYFIEH